MAGICTGAEENPELASLVVPSGDTVVAEDSLKGKKSCCESLP